MRSVRKQRNTPDRPHPPDAGCQGFQSSGQHEKTGSHNNDPPLIKSLHRLPRRCMHLSSQFSAPSALPGEDRNHPGAPPGHTIAAFPGSFRDTITASASGTCLIALQSHNRSFTENLFQLWSKLWSKLWSVIFGRQKKHRSALGFRTPRQVRKTGLEPA